MSNNPYVETYVKELEDEVSQLKEQIKDWHDRFHNGVRYDEENNQYILVWTQRELDQVRKEADEICKKLGW